VCEKSLLSIFFFANYLHFLSMYNVYLLPSIHYSARMKPFENKTQDGSIKWAVLAVYRNDWGKSQTPFDHPASGCGIEPLAYRKPEACLVFIRSLLVHTSSYSSHCRLILRRPSPTAIWSRGESTPPFSHLVIAWCLMEEKRRQDELCHVGLGMLCEAMSSCSSQSFEERVPDVHSDIG